MSEDAVRLTFEATGGTHGGEVRFGQFLQWCITMFGSQEEMFIEALSEPIAESCATLGRSLPPLRHQWALRLFSVYQPQRNGLIKEAHFWELYGLLDGSAPDKLIERYWFLSGAESGVMNFEQFSGWILLQFLDLEDKDFDGQVHSSEQSSAR